MKMTGYTKLFGSIVASTIWREPHTVRIVWITMLAMSNKNGVVESSLPGLADMARVTIPEVKDAVAALESPDEYSRTQDHEGRRIEKCDGGWQILNHGKYRAKMGADEKREYFRVKKQEQRLSKKCPTESKMSKTVQDTSRMSRHAEAQSHSETEAQSSPDAIPSTFPAPTQLRWSAQHGWEGVTEELKTRWQEAYPACNIGRQLLAMQEWCMANPKKAHKKNWLRFINLWLSKSQDRGGDQTSNHQNGHARNSANAKTADDRDFERTGLRPNPIPTKYL